MRNLDVAFVGVLLELGTFGLRVGCVTSPDIIAVTGVEGLEIQIHVQRKTVLHPLLQVRVADPGHAEDGAVDEPLIEQALGLDGRFDMLHQEVIICLLDRNVVCGDNDINVIDLLLDAVTKLRSFLVAAIIGKDI